MRRDAPVYFCDYPDCYERVAQHYNPHFGAEGWMLGLWGGDWCPKHIETKAREHARGIEFVDPAVLFDRLPRP